MLMFYSAECFILRKTEEIYQKISERCASLSYQYKYLSITSYTKSKDKNC